MFVFCVKLLEHFPKNFLQILAKGERFDIQVRLVARSALTISEVAADWHELIILRRTMRPSIARVSEQLDRRCSQQTDTILPPQSATGGLHPVAREIPLISTLLRIGDCVDLSIDYSTFLWPTVRIKP